MAEYCIVDPEGGAVEVWRFRGEPRHERYTKSVPVRVADEQVGEIDLAQVFRRA